MLLGRSNDGFVYLFTEPVRVLAVDDDPIMREFAVAQLSHPGGEVVTAFDGQDAWEKLQSDERGFDLVISDLEMPRMTGFNLCEAIRADARFSHLPVVVITGRDDTFAIDRAYEVGATSFVAKPVNWRLLGYQLRYVLRACRAEGAAAATAREDGDPLSVAGTAGLLSALSREAAARLGVLEEMARDMDQAAGRSMSEAIGDLGALLSRAAAIARVGPASVAETREEISLAGLLTERIRMAEEAAAARGVEIAFERPPPVWRIEGDRRLLTQAVDVLLRRMIAGADEGATLRVVVAPVSGLRPHGGDGFEATVSVQGRIAEDDLDSVLLRHVVEAHAGAASIRRTGIGEAQARIALPAAQSQRQVLLNTAGAVSS